MDGRSVVVAGRWKIDAMLGRNGLGSVYTAFHIDTGKRAAIKVLKISDVDSHVRMRVKIESAALSGLSSSHTVRLLDFGEDENFLFLAYEVVDGTTLDSLVPLPVQSALTVAACVADVLADAHQSGFIHRDIKPSNIIVPRDSGGNPAFSSAMLLDFGVAGLLDNQSRGRLHTAPGQLFGTPVYMAPEQILAAPQTAAVDTYGLGAVLYAMIYGHPPFKGRDIATLFMRTLQDQVVFPPVPFLPAQVRSFIERCLSKDPKQRPQDGLDARTELDLLLGDRDDKRRGPTSIPG